MKILFLSLFFSAIESTGFAQDNKFTGVWTLVSVENLNADSTKSYPYGDNPVGMLVFMPNGDYAIQIMKADRPKIVSNNKNTATPEENKMLVQGNNSHFGTYIVDEENHIITYKPAHAFFPNWEGKELKSKYSLVNGILTGISTTTTNGGSAAIVIWKKKQG